jgi:cell division protein FtsB
MTTQRYEASISVHTGCQTDDVLIAPAIEKFIATYRAMILKPEDLESLKEEISRVEKFYVRMVLMHVIHQNYVEDFLKGKVDFPHIVGLAYAFYPHKDSATSDGFSFPNGEFLSQVLNIYQKGIDPVKGPVVSDLSSLKTATEYFSLKANVHHLNSQLKERSAEMTDLEAKNNELRTDLTSAKQTLTQAQRHIGALQRDFQTLLGENDILRATISTLMRGDLDSLTTYE